MGSKLAPTNASARSGRPVRMNEVVRATDGPFKRGRFGKASPALAILGITCEVQVSARRLRARTRGRLAATLGVDAATRVEGARVWVARVLEVFGDAGERFAPRDSAIPFLVNGSSRLRGTDGLGRSRHRANR